MVQQSMVLVDAAGRRRFAPHRPRHPHAVELARAGVTVNIIQGQLGHSDLGTTSTYLQGIDPSEIFDAVRLRRQPTISATPTAPLHVVLMMQNSSSDPSVGDNAAPART